MCFNWEIIFSTLFTYYPGTKSLPLIDYSCLVISNHCNSGMHDDKFVVSLVDSLTVLVHYSTQVYKFINSMLAPVALEYYYTVVKFQLFREPSSPLQ